MGTIYIPAVSAGANSLSCAALLREATRFIAADPARFAAFQAHLTAKTEPGAGSLVDKMDAGLLMDLSDDIRDGIILTIAGHI